jgi:hypothetical protein
MQVKMLPKSGVLDESRVQPCLAAFQNSSGASISSQAIQRTGFITRKQAQQNKS